MRHLPKYILTCIIIGACVLALMIPGLLLHEILHRRLKVWSPFHLPYFDVALLSVAVFVSAWWVARQSWAVAGRWAGVTVLFPVLFLQAQQNLTPDSGRGDPWNMWNFLSQVILVILVPVVLAYFGGYLGDRKRFDIQAG